MATTMSSRPRGHLQFWPIGADFTGSVITAQPVFLAFRHFAHRAFWAATIRFRAAADSVLFRHVVETTLRPLVLAQRARCAAAIRVRSGKEIVPLRVPLATVSA